jgi:hypothetical protein
MPNDVTGFPHPFHSMKETLTMSTVQQILHYALLRVRVAHDDDLDRGEVSATTIIWAAALVLVALSVSALLVSKITSKADSISF